MKIQESYGVITANEKQWSKLAELIVEYIFDIQLGLNADPFYDSEQPIITLSNLTSYYKCKYHNEIPDNIIPNWLGKMEIQLSKDMKSRGSFAKKTAILENNKLNFTFSISDYVGKSPDEFYDTIMHECRHAYTRWLELSKNIRLDRKGELVYYLINKAFNKYENGEERVPNLVLTIANDVIVLKEGLYDDSSLIAKIIIASLYLTNSDELNSFLLEFQASIKKLILKDIENIKLEVLDYYILKKNGTLINHLSISPLNNNYYKRYKAYLEFWKSIGKVDDKIAEEAILLTEKSIKKYLGIHPDVNLIKYEGDASNILKLLQKKLLDEFNKEIIKMDRIFRIEIEKAS